MLQIQPSTFYIKANNNRILSRTPEGKLYLQECENLMVNQVVKFLSVSDLLSDNDFEGTPLIPLKVTASYLVEQAEADVLNYERKVALGKLTAREKQILGVYLFETKL